MTSSFWFVKRWILVWLAAMTLSFGFVAGGCGGGETDPVNPVPVEGLATLSLVPASASIAVAATQKFLATGADTAGAPVDVTGKVTFESSDPSVATIDATGTATGVKAGTITVTAKVGSISATATLTVIEKKLTALQVEPATATIALKTTQAFIATAKFSDGSTEDVTKRVAWTTSDATVAPIDGSGVAVGIKAGTATITADLTGTTGTATITVTAAKVTSIDVTPPNPTVPAGTTQVFKATATFDDKTTQDVTATATWSSDALSVATIDATGLASALVAGKAKISAKLDTVTGTTELTVTDATITRVDITPLAAVGNAGGPKVKFTATATFSDKTTKDVSADATWTSSDATIAPIDTTGNATPLKSGSVTIGADYKGTKAPSATLAISSAVVTKLDVTTDGGATTANVAVGGTQQFRATATYSDGTTSNVTSAASWTSSATTVATITAAGLGTGVSKGTTTIGATFGGQNGSMTLTVSDATLVSIAISPPGPLSIALGATDTFTAKGTYTDGTTTDITSLVSWSATPAGRVSFTGSVVTGATVGSTTVTATLTGKTSNPVTVNVTDAVITGISISPAAPAAIAIGATLPFTATATYSAGPPGDVTDSVLWTSSNEPVASISNAAGTKGLALGKAGGNTTITASKDGKTSAGVTLTVKPSTVTVASIVVTGVVAGTTINKGATKAYKATASYTDGSTADITNSPLTQWDVVTVSDVVVTTAIATITGYSASGGAGVLTANGPTTGLPGGKAYVRARQGSVSGRQELTIKETTVVSAQVTCGTVQSELECIPSGISFPVGCSVIAFYADGTSDDRTADAVWTSTNTAVAVYDKVVAGLATYTISGNGTATLVATVNGVPSWKPGQPAPTPPQPQRAVVTSGTRTLTATNLTGPAGNTLNLGNKFQYEYRGTYAAPIGCPTLSGFSNTFNLSPISIWTSTFPAIASVSLVEGSVGRVSALTVGNTSIGASFGGFNKTVPLVVVGRCVKKIEVLPTSSTVPQDVLVKLDVKGTYSDDVVESLSPAFGAGAFVTITPSWSDGVSNGVFPATWEYVAKSGTGNIVASLNATDGACGTTAVSSAASTVTVNTALALTALSVTPVAVTIPKGGFADFVARATFGSAGTYNVSFVGNGSTPPFITIWQDEPPLNFTKNLVGQVGGIITYRFQQFSGAPGAAAGVYPTGVTSATATYKTNAAAALLTVSGKAVRDVDILGTQIAGSSYPVGTRPKFRVRVTYTDDTTDTEADVTGITYESSDPSKLRFPSATSNAADAIAQGTTDVVAIYDGVVSPPFPITINANVLCSIDVTAPAGFNPMVRNSTVALEVRGNYALTGGCGAPTQTGVDIGTVVSASSGADTVVHAISDAAGSRAQSFDTDAGPPGVTLSFSKDGRIGTIAMQVSGTGCISAVQISEPSGTLVIPAGVPVQAKVTCTYIGGTVPCVVSSWGRSGISFENNTAFASTGFGLVDSAPGTTGTITATVTSDVCAGTPKVSPARTITAGSATLQSLSLTPLNATIARGTIQQYRLDGTYAAGTGGGVYDLTAALGTTMPRRLFTASAPGVVITILPGGKVQGSSAGGTATINADYDGKLSTFVSINVTGRVRSDILIQAEPNLVGGATTAASYPEGGFNLKLSALGIYADGGAEGDISSSVTWSLETPVVSGVTIASDGTLTTPASVTATATQKVKTTIGSITKTFDVTIVKGSVTGIFLFKGTTAVTTDSVPLGLKTQYDAQVGVGGARYWATRNVTWSSTAPAIASIVASGSSAGELTGSSLGSTTVRAVRGAGTSGDLVVTVSSATPTGLFCAPTTTSVIKGNTLQLRAWVTNSSGPDSDVTNAAGFAVLAGGTSVLTPLPPKGVYQGDTAGTAVKVKVSYINPSTGTAVPPTTAGADECTVTVTP